MTLPTGGFGNGIGRESSSPPQGLAPLVDQVYEELLDAIVERRLPPGMRLIPGSLAHELGVSVTPVKIALTRLIADGLVTSVSRRGVFVSQLDPDQLEDIFEARLFLETGAARAYFDRVTPEFLDALQKAAHDYETLAATGGDHLRRLLGDLDRDFHRLIVRLTGNDHVMRWYEQANVHIQGHRSVIPGERYEATIREHEAIVQAFQSRNAEMAVEALRLHLANAKAHLILMLRTATMMAPRVRRLHAGREEEKISHRSHDATKALQGESITTG